MSNENEPLISRLSNLPVAILSDVLRYAGAPHQVLHSSIQAIAPTAGKSVAGPVFSVRGERLLGGSTPENLRPEMFRRMPSGSIVVMATDGYQDAVVIGENVALSLHVRGCRAVVTDGGIRDRDAIIKMGMPVFSRFVSPLSSGQQWITVELDATVTLPGQASATVRIEPGDLAVGDGDGVIIIPGRGLQTVVEDAEAVLEIEGLTREKLLAGGDPEAVYASLERFKHVRRI
jgi:4-hydroxy-4-methyl-2-oxoglutarate aldolase